VWTDPSPSFCSIGLLLRVTPGWGPKTEHLRTTLSAVLQVWCPSSASIIQTTALKHWNAGELNILCIYVRITDNCWHFSPAVLALYTSTELILRQAQWVQRRVSICGFTILVCNQPPCQTQPSTYSSMGNMGNEYQPKWDDALMLSGQKEKTGTAHSDKRASDL